MLQTQEDRAYDSSQSHAAAAGACLRRIQSGGKSFPRDHQPVAIIHVLLYSPLNSDRHQHLCGAAFVSLSIFSTTHSHRIVIAFYLLSTRKSDLTAEHRRPNALSSSPCTCRRSQGPVCEINKNSNA